MTRNEVKSKAGDEKLVEAYAVKAILTAIDVINKIPDNGATYPELASEGYSLAVEKLREMIKHYLLDGDLLLEEGPTIAEQKKKELKKAPKNKAKKSIKIFNKMAKNITFPH